jgi:hypothetical protein
MQKHFDSLGQAAEYIIRLPAVERSTVQVHEDNSGKVWEPSDLMEAYRNTQEGNPTNVNWTQRAHISSKRTINTRLGSHY